MLAHNRKQKHTFKFLRGHESIWIKPFKYLYSNKSYHIGNPTSPNSGVNQVIQLWIRFVTKAIYLEYLSCIPDWKRARKYSQLDHSTTLWTCRCKTDMEQELQSSLLGREVSASKIISLISKSKREKNVISYSFFFGTDGKDKLRYKRNIVKNHPSLMVYQHG